MRVAVLMMGRPPGSEGGNHGGSKLSSGDPHFHQISILFTKSVSLTWIFFDNQIFLVLIVAVEVHRYF